MVNWQNQEYITGIVSASHNYASCLRAMDLHVSTGNYKTLKKYIAQYAISIEHFDTWRDSAERGRRSRTPLDEILVENSTYTTKNLKKRLIEGGLLPYVCSDTDCGLTEWKEKPIALHLDHINGVPNDNRIENLRLLCPNCHSQTPTFAGRNARTNVTNHCLDCKDVVHVTSLRCIPCAAVARANPTRIEWPPSAELLARATASSYSALARELGVSDNAIRNRIARHP